MCFTDRLKPYSFSEGKNSSQVNVSFALIAESCWYLHFFAHLRLYCMIK